MLKFTEKELNDAFLLVKKEIGIHATRTLKNPQDKHYGTDYVPIFDVHTAYCRASSSPSYSMSDTVSCSGTLAPVTHLGDLDGMLSSQLQLVLALTVVGIYGVSTDASFSFSSLPIG